MRLTCRNQKERFVFFGPPPPLGGMTLESSIPNSSINGVASDSEVEATGGPGSRS